MKSILAASDKMSHVCFGVFATDKITKFTNRFKAGAGSKGGLARSQALTAEKYRKWSIDSNRVRWDQYRKMQAAEGNSEAIPALQPAPNEVQSLDETAKVTEEPAETVDPCGAIWFANS